MPKPINQHVLIRDDNHLIRYARTRHLTMTRVSRFVYLLHTAPVPETTAPPFEERAATPGWSNPQSPLGMGARPGAKLQEARCKQSSTSSKPSASQSPSSTSGSSNAQPRPTHLGNHRNLAHVEVAVMPSLEDQLDQNEWDLEQARRAGNPNAIDLLLDERNILLADIHNTRTTR